MNMYCSDCKQLICRDCTIKLHRDHDHEFVKVSAPDVKKQLIQQLEPLQILTANMLCEKKMVQETSLEVEAWRQSAFGEIGTFIEQLHNILEDWKQQLITKTNMAADQKTKLLSEQEERISFAYAAVQSVIDYTEQCVEHAADDEIVCMQAEIQSRIDRVLQEQQKEGKAVEPVEEADLGVELSCVEELKQLCQTKARITRLPVH